MQSLALLCGLTKEAGGSLDDWKNAFGKVLKVHAQPVVKGVAGDLGQQAGDLYHKGVAHVQNALQDPDLARKMLARASSGGGALAATPAATGAKVLAKEKGKELLRGAGKWLQRAGE